MQAALHAYSVLFHRTVYEYAKAKWCGFCSFFSQVSEDLIISDDVHKSAQEYSQIAGKIFEALINKALVDFLESQHLV